MKTDALIRALAADHAVRAPAVERFLAATVAAGFIASAILFAAILGPRPDIATVAMSEPRFLFKFVVTLVLALSAALLVRQLARPGAQVHLAWLAAAPVLILFAVGVELMLVPAAAWEAKVVGTNARICLTMVPLLSVPLLAAALLALRNGAPTRPALAGAVAGLLAGGLGATLYAAHCTDDSPLFVVTWYTLAIALVVAAGALLGSRLLRW
jgi:hypothetical protein